MSQLGVGRTVGMGGIADVERHEALRGRPERAFHPLRVELIRLQFTRERPLTTAKPRSSETDLIHGFGSNLLSDATLRRPKNRRGERPEVRGQPSERDAAEGLTGGSVTGKVHARRAGQTPGATARH